ncbi:hairy/enhancer-of-split related with YRPW motif-like protein [Oncorhynchus tshawytscha]|uniref:Hairy/enhancer-of-split related with YRPW motif-like protein n=1 Tax=Oncorhynchus tshawytscha TaxID=74940 RepID=A0AAZ3P8U7_ONCTS|nr:hairy/enhancer-of-split related with YRPW motif-like protein [Oncorhynchus tshawytscha]XP_042166495.1 hairy/enhancer-of-split related with YRPW motif-like protein [Oncorhynchus tshawytscha]
MKTSHNDYSSPDSDDMDGLIDVGQEDGSCPVTGSMSPGSTSQILARKKRRGIIEKRRRDRINHSLSELRRLVPTASEKQGSSKLEKAEILQMTVDHLKLLHAMGGKGYLDARVLAVDYRTLGFRQCVGEVVRYLGSLEGGVDSPDPIGARLVSHLSHCASQLDPLLLQSPPTSSSLPFPPWPWISSYHQMSPVSSPHSPSFSARRRELARLGGGCYPSRSADTLCLSPLGCQQGSMLAPALVSGLRRVPSLPPPSSPALTTTPTHRLTQQSPGASVLLTSSSSSFPTAPPQVRPFLPLGSPVGQRRGKAAKTWGTEIGAF